ncbi:MAG: hypothetical protein IJ349_02420 [Clostridia bacterium]|nr:hypothetical protein [Clostridia bacterium]
MEEENQVFGVNAENTDDFDSEEKFSIYHKDKEDIEKNIQASAKELEDFFDSVIKDEPDPTQEEVKEGVRKILERAYPEKKTGKSKKVVLKVLFVAAILSALAFSCLFAIGNSHDISIENGFVTFAKDTVKVVFFGEDEETLIDVKTLIEDLNSHGYENVLIPQKFEEYMSSLPEYSESLLGVSEMNKNLSFELHNDDMSYAFFIEKNDSPSNRKDYFVDIKNAKTVIVGELEITVFEFENGFSSMRYLSDGYSYVVYSKIPFSEMINAAQTIIKTEG